MIDYDPSRYGELWAAAYDRHYGPWSGELNPAAVVRFIRSRASDGPVLELGVGTGRVAIPLVASGSEVHGLDSAPAMLAELAAKPGGGSVHLILANMADFSSDRSYAAVICLFNSLLLLPTMDLQRRCFKNVARSLKSGGAFIVEAMVPDFTGLRDDRAVQILDTPLGTEKRVTIRDRRARTLYSTYFDAERPTNPVREVLLRYTSTDEMDEMAADAGFHLAERWSDWEGSPFTRQSRAHVSVYRRR